MSSLSSYSNVWCFMFIVVLGNISMLAHRVGGEKPLVPCFFIFGDSFYSAETDQLTDPRPLLKRPYGIDFPDEPVATRYTNGLNAIDLIGELLGFEQFIQPYSNISSTDQVSKGINYASSFMTNFHPAMLDVFGQQLSNHNNSINCYYGGSNNATTQQYLNKCLYSLGFANEVHLTSLASQIDKNFTVNKFLPLYVNNIQKLLNVGAKKILVHGVGPLGCTPTAISLHNIECGCAEEVNSVIQHFNAELRSKLDEFNNDNPDVTLMYIDTYEIFSDLFSADFKVTNQTCCATQWDGLCLSGGTPCQNRTDYIFFDGFHPTEAANRIIANKAFNNISCLVSS